MAIFIILCIGIFILFFVEFGVGIVSIVGVGKELLCVLDEVRVVGIKRGGEEIREERGEN